MDFFSINWYNIIKQKQKYLTIQGGYNYEKEIGGNSIDSITDISGRM